MTLRAIRHAPTEALVAELARRRMDMCRKDVEYRISLRRRPIESVLLFIEGFLNMLVLLCHLIIAIFSWVYSKLKSLTCEQRLQLCVIITAAVPLLLGSALVFQYPTVVHRFRLAG